MFFECTAGEPKRKSSLTELSMKAFGKAKHASTRIKEEMFSKPKKVDDDDDDS